MAEIPRQVLSEVSPGVYTGAYTVVDATPDGTFVVVATLSAPGLAAASATSAQLTIEKRPPPGPVPSPGSVPPTTKGAGALPEWVNWLADVIGWAVVLWGIAAAANFAGVFNVFVALALLALTVVFRDQLVAPIQKAVRFIFGTIIEVIQDVVTFIRTWLEAIAKEFQGNFVRAILRIVILAAFMWIWERAQSVPAVKQLIDLIVDTSAKIIKWVNDTIDQFQGRLDELRLDVLKSLDVTRGDQSAFGRALSEFITREVNTLFGQLGGELQKLRVQLLGEFDVRLLAVRAEVTVLGQRFRLFPEEVRLYIAGRFLDLVRSAQRVAENQDALDAVAFPPSALDSSAPGRALAEVKAEILALTPEALTPAAAALLEAAADVATYERTVA